MEDMLSTITRQFLPRMEPEERGRAIASLRAIIDPELLGLAQKGMGSDDIETCPHCGPPCHTKHDFAQYGNQRHLCKGCARTFTARSRRIFSTTKLPREAWMRFIQYHADVLPLRESAEQCGVCPRTAYGDGGDGGLAESAEQCGVCPRIVFFMRHRLLEAARKIPPSFQVGLGCGAELDERFFRESFESNHARLGTGVSRRAHGRVRATDNLEKIYVLTGTNDSGGILYEITGRGGLDKDAAARLLAEKLADGAIISTDKAHVYRQVLLALGIGEHRSFACGEHAIDRVNNLRRNIKGLTGRFNGAATCRLSNYLPWFKWIWPFKIRASAALLADLIVKQATAFTYETTWHEYKMTPYPFFDYLIKQAKWNPYARKAIYGTA